MDESANNLRSPAFSSRYNAIPPWRHTRTPCINFRRTPTHSHKLRIQTTRSTRQVPRQPLKSPLRAVKRLATSRLRSPHQYSVDKYSLAQPRASAQKQQRCPVYRTDATPRFSPCISIFSGPMPLWWRFHVSSCRLRKLGCSWEETYATY